MTAADTRHRRPRPPSSAGACTRLGVPGLLLAVMLLGVATPGSAQQEHVSWTGDTVMREVLRRHQQFPYVYEEQTMVLSDGDGNRDVRRCRQYIRVEADGTVKFLLVFDDPAEIRGVALLATRDVDGNGISGVYLPALGPTLKRPRDADRAGQFLGTDFAVQDLGADRPGEFRYVLNGRRSIEDVDYFVLEAYPRDEQVGRDTGYGLRRMLIREDNFVIIQTDFYDTRLQFLKRLTRHDLQRVLGDTWRANMTIAEVPATRHRTLLKVDQRIYSRDYVPAEIFEPAYLFANRHVPGAAVHAADDASPIPRRGDAGDG